MKIYVVLKGQYSDRYIVGVAETREKAEMIAEAVSGRYMSEKADIEEYDTDQFSDRRFRYQVTENGYDDLWQVEYDDWDYNSDYPESCHAYGDVYIVYANSPQQAIKIAQDIKAQIEAEKAGIV